MATRRNVKTEGSETADTSKHNVARDPAAPAPKAPRSLNVPGYPFRLSATKKEERVNLTGPDRKIYSAVVAKLLLFTLAMVAAPLATYYISVTRVFVGTCGRSISTRPRRPPANIDILLLLLGNATAAGALAAVAANVVLIAYVVVAMTEDDTDEKDRKSQ